MRGIYAFNAVLWFVQAGGWASHRTWAGLTGAAACFAIGVACAVWSDKLDDWSW